MSGIMDHPQVKHSSGTNDGSLDIELPGGAWIAYPEAGAWIAQPYNGKDDSKLGPFASAEEAVLAVLAL